MIVGLAFAAKQPMHLQVATLNCWSAQGKNSRIAYDELGGSSRHPLMVLTQGNIDEVFRVVEAGHPPHMRGVFAQERSRPASHIQHRVVSLQVQTPGEGPVGPFAQMAETDPGWYIYQTPGPSPWIDPNQLIQQKGLLTDASYRRLSQRKRPATPSTLGPHGRSLGPTLPSATVPLEASLAAKPIADPNPLLEPERHAGQQQTDQPEGHPEIEDVEEWMLRGLRLIVALVILGAELLCS